VFRDVEMKDPASTVFDNEETVQDSKGESGHREEVHGRAVIAQESSPEFPCLLRRRQALDIARNCPFRDLEAEVERFTMNSGSAPGGILFHHPLDEKSNLGIDLWPAKAHWARVQAPEQPKASPMPGDNGFWFDDNQDAAPSLPKAAEQNPKYPILDSQSRVRRFSLEHAQLLTEGRISRLRLLRERNNALRQVSKPRKNAIMGPDLYHRVRSGARVNCLNLLPHGVLTTHKLIQGLPVRASTSCHPESSKTQS
jgi:hypothetical protein